MLLYLLQLLTRRKLALQITLGMVPFLLCGTLLIFNFSEVHFSRLDTTLNNLLEMMQQEIVSLQNHESQLLDHNMELEGKLLANSEALKIQGKKADLYMKGGEIKGGFVKGTIPLFQQIVRYLSEQGSSKEETAIYLNTIFNKMGGEVNFWPKKATGASKLKSRGFSRDFMEYTNDALQSGKAAKRTGLRMKRAIIHI